MYGNVTYDSGNSLTEKEKLTSWLKKKKVFLKVLFFQTWRFLTVNHNISIFKLGCFLSESFYKYLSKRMKDIRG